MPRNDLPQVLRFGSLVYSVLRVSQDDLPENAEGEMDMSAKVIKVLDEEHDVVALATMFHEAAHVWMERSGLSKQLEFNEACEEAVCDCIGWGVAELLLENAGLAGCVERMRSAMCGLDEKHV